MQPVRLTMATTAVVLTLIDHAGEELHGYAVCRETGLSSGVVYPILGRLAEAGWLTSRPGAPEDTLGPRRLYYRFTPDGQLQARARLGITPQEK